jgi:hypothetical protein
VTVNSKEENSLYLCTNCPITSKNSASEVESLKIDEKVVNSPLF